MPSSELIADSLHHAPLLLDGATGTELERRGAGGPPPLWSAAALLTAPAIVQQIHADYVAAGADILVADTFRTNPRTLRRAGLYDRGRALNRLAVALARAAAKNAPHQPVWVAASVAPVEDCYRPDLVPSDDELEHEHAELLDWLAAAGPDLLWLETMNTAREARIAAAAAAIRNLPLAASFVVAEDGRLLGGDTLEEAVQAVEPLQPLALGLNCIPPRGATALLPRLRHATGRPLAVYAHVNNVRPIRGWSYAQSVGPEEYAAYAAQWISAGASIVGGCCGTQPAHIRAIRARIAR